MYRNTGIILGLLLLSACNMQQGGSAKAPAATTLSTSTIASPPNPALDRQIEAYDQAIRLSNDPVTKARSQLNKGNAQMIGGRHPAAIATFDELIRTWGTESHIELRRLVAIAILNTGQAYKRLNLPSQEVAAYSMLIERFDNASDLALRRHMASGYTYLAEAHRRDKKPQEVATLLNVARSRRCADLDEAIQYNCARMLRTLAAIRQDQRFYEDAADLYAEVVKEYGSRLGVRVKPEVVDAQLARATILQEHLKRPKDAQDAYESVLAMSEPPTDARSRVNRGIAFVGLASILSNLNRKDEAIRIYDKAIGEFDKDTSVGGTYIASRAAMNKAHILQATGRASDALTLFEAGLTRVEPQRAAIFDELKLAGHVGRGQALLRMQRYEESIAAFDTAVNRFGTSTNTNVREFAAKSALAKAQVMELQRLRLQLKDLTKTLDDKILQEEANAEPKRSENVSSLMLAKGTVLGAVGFYDEAAGIFDTMIVRYGASEAPILRQATASAYYSKALMLHGRGTSYEAAGVMRELITRYANAPESGIRKTVQQAQQWLEANRQFDAVG